MHSVNDDQYIEKVLLGDVEAFSVLIKKYQDYVYHIAYKIVKNQFDAEEVAQDTFLKAYKNLETFSREAKFSSWLYKIAYYTAISKTRNKYNQMHGDPLNYEVISMEAVTDTNEMLANLKTEEQQKYINLAMVQLPDQVQLVLSLFYLEESTLKEIEEITGISISNIKTLMHRGRKQLYGVLENILKKELKSIV